MFTHRVLAAAFLAAVVSPVFADPVAFGGVTLFEIKAGAAGKTPAQRVAEVEVRLVDILGETKISDKDVVVKADKSERKILVKNRLLVTVTKEDAAFHKTTIDKVAKNWRDQIAKKIVNMHLLPEQVGPTAPPAKKR